MIETIRLSIHDRSHKSSKHQIGYLREHLRTGVYPAGISSENQQYYRTKGVQPVAEALCVFLAEFEANGRHDNGENPSADAHHCNSDAERR